MLSGRNLGGDLGEMQAHRLGVAVRQDQRCPFAVLGADCAEDVGRRGTLIMRCAGTAATLGPTTGDLVLLADPVDRLRRSTVGEPDFYIGRCDVLRRGDFFQAGGETFLKSSTAPSACA